MGLKKPLVLGSGGQVEQLQSGDSLDASTTNPEQISLTNAESGSVVKGAPLYIFGDGSVKKAVATSASTAKVLGLVADTTIAGSASGNVITDGPLTATTTQWDAVAGTTGGLTPGADYFLGGAAGTITETAPTATGSSVVLVGRALSSTVLNIKIGQGILL